MPLSSRICPNVTRGPSMFTTRPSHDIHRHSCTRTALGIALCSACLSIARPSYADDESATATATSDTEIETVERWYGWQTLAADGAALALVIGGAAVTSQVDQGAYIIMAGGVVHVVGGPIIHFTHQRIAAGFGSMGLRAALPVFGAAIGASAEDCSGGFVCGLVGGFIGFFLGFSGSIAIDAAALAYEETTPEDPNYGRAAPTPTWAVLPNLTADQTGLAVIGTF